MPLKDTTTGEDIFEAVIKCFEIYKLDLSKLVSVTTDGVAVMVGIRNGFVSLLEKHLHSAGYDNNLFKIHCIIHQEALCAKNVDVKEIMEVVVKIINYIRSNGLNHRQFQELLHDLDSQQSDLIYFCDVRWLSRGNMLQRFYELREEIIFFLEMKGKSYPQLQDPTWIAELAFLVDITGHLNQLNLKLQGKNQLVNGLYKHIVSFETKLALLEKQIAKLDFTNFPLLNKNPPSGISVQMAFMIVLREQF